MLIKNIKLHSFYTYQKFKLSMYKIALKITEECDETSFKRGQNLLLG